MTKSTIGWNVFDVSSMYPQTIRFLDTESGLDSRWLQQFNFKTEEQIAKEKKEYKKKESYVKFQEWDRNARVSGSKAIDAVTIQLKNMPTGRTYIMSSKVAQYEIESWARECEAKIQSIETVSDSDERGFALTRRVIVFKRTSDAVACRLLWG